MQALILRAWRQIMINQDISECIVKYIENQELSGAALMIRKNGELVYQNKWGYQSLEHKIPVEYNSIYRMMSMTKCVTGVAILKLMEQGKIRLDDAVSKYVPEFAKLSVSKDIRYIFDKKKMKRLPWYLLTFKMDKVKTEAANREITIRDLLSHASGLEQGLVGFLALLKMKNEDKTLKERVMRYSKYVLDFQPGTGTGYSPAAGFDILGYIIEIVTGMRYEEYLQKEICMPLEMKDTTFFLNKEQKSRLVEVYKQKKGKLLNVTGTKADMGKILHQDVMRFEQGCGGLFSTIIDYEHFAEMLCSHGNYRGLQFLKPETVELMHTEAQEQHLVPEPGFVWGLSVKIRENPEIGGSFATKETYGWSGAFGTHFFVSPIDNLEAVFVTNRSDLEGSGSYVSKKVEELVFGIYA